MGKKNKEPSGSENSLYYYASDVMKLMEYKERKAYQIIRELNDELAAMGKLTIAGRINKTYFHHRFDINSDDLKNGRG